MANRRFFAAGLIASSRKSIQAGLKKRGLSNRALIVGIVLFSLAVTLAHQFNITLLNGHRLIH